MMISEAVILVFQDLSFEMERLDAPSHIKIPPEQAELNEERAPTPAEVAPTLHDEVPVELENHHIENCGMNLEDFITREMKSAYTYEGIVHYG